MGIGAYRHLVTLEHPAVVLDSPRWQCSMQSAASQVADGLAAFILRGRFHPGMTLETQLLFEGRRFQVQGISDLDERHREMQVMCVEVVGRGTTPGGEPVAVPPTILEGPEGADIEAGESVILTVIAEGSAPLTYQWLADGAALPGAVYQFYETGPLEVTTSYQVRVSNLYGTVVSAPAIVTVPVVVVPVWTLIGSVTAQPGESGGTTAPIDTTGADLLVVTVAYYVGGPPPSDSYSNTWTMVTNVVHPDGAIRMFYANEPVVGVGHTFTALGSSSYAAIIVQAFSGASAAPFDAQTSAQTSAGPPLQPGSMTPSVDGTLIISATGGNNMTTPVVDSGLIQTTLPLIGGVSMAGSVGYKVQEVAAPINPAWTWGGTPHAGVNLVVFLPAGARRRGGA